MNRTDWLRSLRTDTEAKYDEAAPLYAEKWGVYRNLSHQQFIQKFLSRLRPHSKLLDAACGAGRYMPFLLEQGHTVLGIDQSQGMLARAKELCPGIQTEKLGVQELSYREAFDGLVCIDAMEHVCPEDWPLVLENFYRALKPSGYLYFTVELADPAEVEEGFKAAQAIGLPAVAGEWINDDVYHYYPTMEQVRDWLQQAGFQLIEEGEGDGYQHFIAQKPQQP